MNIAVVHDYFIQMGGAERVAEVLYDMLPDPTLVTTVALPERLSGALRGVPFESSWMQSLPGIRKFYRYYFLLYPLAVRSLNLDRFDLVVSSSSGYAKGVKTHPDALHVCYCHTPMRWVWNYDSYVAREAFGFAQRAILPLLVRSVKDWDRSASQQPDHFVANSRTVAERIYKVYGRRSEIIYPPIDVRRFAVLDQQDDYYLVLSRLIAYKRIDIAVEACTRLNRRLIVIGEGPDHRDLAAMAGPSVEFLGRLPDQEVNRYVSRCRALIFPGEEDFGMVPLEVAAAGRPTLAYKAGGALETILDGVSGLYFREQTPAALMDTIGQFEQQNWDPLLMRRHAEQFDIEVFQKRFLAFLNHIGVPLPTRQIQNSRAAESPATLSS